MQTRTSIVCSPCACRQCLLPHHIHMRQRVRRFLLFAGNACYLVRGSAMVLHGKRERTMSAALYAAECDVTWQTRADGVGYPCTRRSVMFNANANEHCLLSLRVQAMPVSLYAAELWRKQGLIEM
ncbi:hypothetical protein LJB83_02415 [Clostridia bacterium OttesenSCG-928-F22]|nr:hypothetical protein [Clostridia bacterium OttesenSCG-928-F22]